MNSAVQNSHNFVGDCFAPAKIAIIGGHGAMGRRLAEEFRNDGLDVQCTGQEPLQDVAREEPRKREAILHRWNSSACSKADVVIFAVPIPVLAGHDRLKRIFGRVPPRGWRHKLVLDICSTKCGPALALARLHGPTVIPMHPMFGPRVRPLTGQAVFICPLRSPECNRVLQRRLEIRLQWLKDFWTRRGVHVVETAPEEHDRFMTGAQFGVLLSVLMYAGALNEAGISFDQLQHRGTPNSRALCTRMARMIAPEMLQTYANLACENPHNVRWLDLTIANLVRLKSWLSNGDRQAILSWMAKLADHQPAAFRKHFREYSTFLDQCTARQDFIADCLIRETQIKELLQGKPYAG